MVIRLALVFGMAATLTTSCTTQRLWRATDPNASVSIPKEQISEAELQERGVPYRKDDYGIYHVGKTKSQRFGDHALRFVFAPAAVCVDATPVVAFLLLNGLAEGQLEIPIDHDR